MTDFSSVDSVTDRIRFYQNRNMIEEVQRRSRCFSQIKMLLDAIDDPINAGRADRQRWIQEAYQLAVSAHHIHYRDHLEFRFPYLKA